MAPLLIHVGYPKTASTFLQNELFANGDLGLCAPWGARSGLAVDEFVIRNPFRFDPDAVRQVFEPGLCHAEAEGLVATLSEETLASVEYRKHRDTKAVADRIHAVFPNARILICIREQCSMILSLYNEYIRGGAEETLEEFLGLGPRRPGIAPPCQLDYLEYDLLLTHYYDLFGAENVLVLPYELLRDNATEFAVALLSFVGRQCSVDIDSTPRYHSFMGGFTVAVRRHLNTLAPRERRRALRTRVVGKACRLLDRLSPSSLQTKLRTRMRAMICEHVGDYYKASNRRTSELVGCRLEKFGYSV